MMQTPIFIASAVVTANGREVLFFELDGQDAVWLMFVVSL